MRFDLRDSDLRCSRPLRLVARAVAGAMSRSARCGDEWLVDYEAIQRLLDRAGRPMSVATIRQWIGQLVADGIMFRDGHRVGFVERGARPFEPSQRC